MKNMNIPVTLNCFGIIRNLDSLGRIVIPVEWRNLYDINKSSKVEMIMTDKGILITKAEDINNTEK